MGLGEHIHDKLTHISTIQGVFPSPLVQSSSSCTAKRAETSAETRNGNSHTFLPVSGYRQSKEKNAGNSELKKVHKFGVSLEEEP